MLYSTPVGFLARMQLGITMRQARTVRDLVAVIVVFILCGFFTATFDLYEKFSEHTRSLENWEIDEIPLVLLVLAISCAWFAYRRWKELKGEIDERKRAEAEYPSRVSPEHRRWLVTKPFRGERRHTAGQFRIS